MRLASAIVVIIVMGVSGSGKTTVGRALAHAVNGDFQDADDFHSPANVDKMRRGIPLSASDREPWAQSLRNAIDEWLKRPGVTVLACSALTSRIRRALGVHRDGVHTVLLHGDEDLIAYRMRQRKHFMPSDLLESQLALLEPPSDALVLDVAKPVDELVGEIRRGLGV